MLQLTCEMDQITVNGTITATPVFASRQEIKLKATNLNELYRKLTDNILESIATFNQRGSGFVFKRIKELIITISDYEANKVGSFIELPKVLKSKHAIINMQNKDDQCFKWCVTRALNPVDKDPGRITSKLKEQAEKLNWSRVKFPVKFTDIDRFEKDNSDIAIRVFKFDEKENKVTTIRDTKHEKPEEKKLINLLHIEAIDKDGKFNEHFCYIKNMSAFLSGGVYSKNDYAKKFCFRCGAVFSSEKARDNHFERCKTKDQIIVNMPKEGEHISFKNFDKMDKVPFAIYADFESFTIPVDLPEVPPSPDSSYTQKYQKHVPSGFCYYIVFKDDIEPPRRVEYIATSSDDDVGEKFSDMITNDVSEILTKYDKAVEINFTKEDRKLFNSSTTCHICGGEIKQDQKKIKDHDHITGKFRGAAHNSCNLNYKTPNFIPVFFHNLTGYDVHLFINKLAEKRKDYLYTKQ